MVAYSCHPKIQDAESRRCEFQASLRYTARPCLPKRILWKRSLSATSEATHSSQSWWSLTELHAWEQVLCIQNPTLCEAFQLLPRAEIQTTLHGTYCSLQMTSRSRCGLFKQNPHRELKTPSSRRWWCHKTTTQPLTLGEGGSEREGANIKAQDTTNGARTRNCCGEFHFFRPIHQVLFV